MPTTLFVSRLVGTRKIWCLIWYLTESWKYNKVSRQRNSETCWKPMTAILVTCQGDIVGCSIWDMFETWRRHTDGTSLLRPLEMLSRRSKKMSWTRTTETSWWDVVGCFIWDIPATSLGCTKRICKCSLFHNLTLIERYVFLFLYGVHINQFCLMIMQILLLFSINILFQFFIYYIFINCPDRVLYSF